MVLCLTYGYWSQCVCVVMCSQKSMCCLIIFFMTVKSRLKENINADVYDPIKSYECI